jgi:hypothetical protein
MAFIGNGACPKCQERGNDKRGNNLAEYSSNFYCWSCGYYKDKNNLARFKPINNVRVCNGITLQKSLEVAHLKWLLGYNLTLDECKQFHSSHERVVNGQKVRCNLLVLACVNDYWIGRNFSEGVKYLSSGIKPFLKYGNNPDVLVFVEDVVSAVKVGRVATAVPMLGASILHQWWDNVKEYKRVIIFGDRDKAKENVIASRKASEILGRKVEVVITDKDPKCYNDKEIKEILTIN